MQEQFCSRQFCDMCVSSKQEYVHEPRERYVPIQPCCLSASVQRCNMFELRIEELLLPGIEERKIGKRKASNGPGREPRISKISNTDVRV